MVQPPSHPVNSHLAQGTKNLIIQQATIWGLCATLAFILYVSGAEESLARNIYQPNLQTKLGYYAWQARQYGAFPIGIFASLCLMALFIRPLATRTPLLYRSCVVIALTALLGAGLFNQVIVKQLADRPRPRDFILTQPTSSIPPVELQGNSMPSGHAGMGYVLAAPFFVLYSRRRKLALASLAVGVTTGTVIGASRMVLGAHFASDVLIAAAISLSTASLIAALLGPHPHPSLFTKAIQRLIPASPRRWVATLATLTAATGAIFTLSNHFSMHLTMPLPQPFRNIDIPCLINTLPNQTGVTTPTLHVHLTGYGAPLSQLQLIDNEGEISLQTHYGLYRNLACTAQILLPAQVTD